MPSDRTIAEFDIGEALKELRLGKKQAARSRALKALSLSPQLEEPWLILAAIASPRASIAYLEQALEINPLNEHAHTGLDQARARLPQEATQPVRRITASASALAEPPTQSIPASRPAARKKVLHRLRQSRHMRLWGLLLISPWLIGLVIFTLAPLLATLGISFTDFFLLTPNTMSFVGFKNYIDSFRDPYMYSAFLGTVKLALIVIPLQTVAAVLLAALLSDEKLRLKDTLRVLFFLPSIIPSAAATFMWEGFTSPTGGWLYSLFLNPLGLAKYMNLLNQGDISFLPILAMLWSIGPGFMIIMGAMQGLPVDIFEAALVDGANRLRRFFSITLPMISPAIFFTLILNLTAVFGGALLLDRGSAFYSDRSSVDNYLYFLMFRTFHLGEAASVALIFFIFLLVLVMLLFATSRRWVYFPDQEN